MKRESEERRGSFLVQADLGLDTPDRPAGAARKGFFYFRGQLRPLMRQGGLREKEIHEGLYLASRRRTKWKGKTLNC